VITALAIVLGAGACAALVSILMWRATQRSGLASLILGVVFGYAAFVAAIIIGYLMSRGRWP
jgi:hypothetical protein